VTESPTSAAPLPRRAVVTGATGFIGSHLVHALREAGVTVVGIDRRAPQAGADAGAAASLPLLHRRADYTQVTADLQTCDLHALLRDTDVVYHLAGIPGVRSSWGSQFTEYVNSNILATGRLMNAATAIGIPRLVVASSSSVYGATDGGPSAETDPPRPASPYAVTKLAEEQLCLAYAARPGCPTDVVALRYFTVYGPRQRPDMFIHRVLHAALAGTPLRIYGRGHQRRDFTYVGDAVTATLAAGGAPAGTGIVNVGGGTTASLQEVLDIARHITGTDIRVQYETSRSGDVPVTRADPRRALTVLGWSPATDLTRGIEAQLRELTRQTKPVLT
jgi:UDP-glucuronate 4-epimerase